jgi:hypothetical protein
MHRSGVSRQGAVADHERHTKLLAVVEERNAQLRQEIESLERVKRAYEELTNRTRVRRFLMRIPGIAAALLVGYGVGAGIL